MIGKNEKTKISDFLKMHEILKDRKNFDSCNHFETGITLFSVQNFGISKMRTILNLL
jgi:hypothetical protein